MHLCNRFSRTSTFTSVVYNNSQVSGTKTINHNLQMRKLRLRKTNMTKEMLRKNARTRIQAFEFQVFSFFHYSIQLLSPSYRSYPSLFLVRKEKGKINIWEMVLTLQEEKNKSKILCGPLYSEVATDSPICKLSNAWDWLNGRNLAKTDTINILPCTIFSPRDCNNSSFAKNSHIYSDAPKLY